MDPTALPLSKALVLLAWCSLAIVLLRRVKSRARDARRDTSSLLGMAIQGIAFALAWTDIPLGRPTTGVLRGAAVLLALGSVWLAARAVAALGHHFSLAARTLEQHELVTTGPYASVRHPIYSAMLGLLVATTLTFGRPLTLLASIPIYLLGTRIRLVREERLLGDVFGEAWTEYASRVPALLPRWH